MVEVGGTRHRVPRWVRVLTGLACVAAGAVLTTRPFTALSVLVLLVGTAAIATGLSGWSSARGSRHLDQVVATGWIALGLGVLVWPDLSVRGVAVLVGVGMLAGGLATVLAGMRGTVDERLAAVLRGAASVVFGVLALAWPDVTLLVVAVVFGVRTVLFGLSQLVAAVRGPGSTGHQPSAPVGLLRRSAHLVGSALALVAALALGATSAALHRGGPAIDAFYRTPDDVPARPGALLRAEPFDRTLPESVRGWRILYTTTRDDGVPAVASAIVIVPAAASPAPRPVIAWAHGTTGVDRTCAPSLLADPLGAGAFFALDLVVAEGWALVATDYTGLGTEGTHPYMVGQAEGRSVLDAVRAARALDGPSLDPRTVVWGHSQGGGAALWAGQLAATYAPDAGVLGVAALAPASNLPAFADTVAVSPGGSIFASYLVTGYASAYPDVAFDDYVRPTARTVVRELAGRCLGEPEVLMSVLTSLVTDMSVFSADLRSGALGQRLAENVPGGPFEVPLLIAQGEADPLILPDAQVEYSRGLCRGGATVDYRSYEGKDHVGLVTADSPLMADLVRWTQARLDGDPAVSTCSP